MRIQLYFELILILILFSLKSAAIAQAGIKDTLLVKVTFYDFHADGSNPEFNPDYTGGVYNDMVLDTLDSERKPIVGTNIFFNKYIHKWFRRWTSSDYTIPVYAGRSGEYDRISKVAYDTAFKNIVINDSLPFLYSGDSVYQFERSGANGTQEFFWIDGNGFGNEPATYKHNYSFTMELHTFFTFKKGLRFEFLGDDDVWAFVNNRLVLDLGGIHGSQRGTVKMDSIGPVLGLIEGEVYTFDFFYAERHVSKSCIKITTNMINRTDGNGPKVTTAILRPNTDIHGKDTMIVNFSTPILCTKLFSVSPESSFVYTSDGTNLIKGASYLGNCTNTYINSVKILVTISSNTNQQNDSIAFRKGVMYVTDPEDNHPNTFAKTKVEIDRKSSIQVMGYPSPASPDVPFSGQIRKAYSPIIGNNISGTLVGIFTRVPLQLVPGTDRYGTADIYDATANVVYHDLPLKFSGTSGVYGIYWNIKNRNDRIVGNGTYLVVIKAKYYDGEKIEKRIKIAVSR